MYGFKAYPSDRDIAMATEALVAKHPCLKEAGSTTGWNGWKNSIKFKMGNYMNKMRRAGCQEVAVNGGKRSRINTDSDPSHCNIKRPRRAEVNFLPNFPRGEDTSSLEHLRKEIVEEVKKTEKNLTLIRKDDADNICPAATDHSEDLPISEQAHGPLACSQNGVRGVCQVPTDFKSEPAQHVLHRA